MSVLTQPLRDEHQELRPHIEAMRDVADSLADEPLETARQRVAETHDFLAHHLLRHAQAEERALYPVVARLMGASGATATMSRDHVEIARLTDELGVLRSRLSGTSTLDSGLTTALRRVLYGLFALVRTHFAKEEEVYLPILDAGLSEQSAREMFAAMEKAASELAAG